MFISRLVFFAEWLSEQIYSVPVHVLTWSSTSIRFERWRAFPSFPCRSAGLTSSVLIWIWASPNTCHSLGQSEEPRGSEPRSAERLSEPAGGTQVGTTEDSVALWRGRCDGGWWHDHERGEGKICLFHQLRGILPPVKSSLPSPAFLHATRNSLSDSLVGLSLPTYTSPCSDTFPINNRRCNICPFPSSSYVLADNRPMEWTWNVLSLGHPYTRVPFPLSPVHPGSLSLCSLFPPFIPSPIWLHRPIISFLIWFHLSPTSSSFTPHQHF